jgi:hypothetical protein
MCRSCKKFHSNVNVTCHSVYVREVGGGGVHAGTSNFLGIGSTRQDPTTGNLFSVFISLPCDLFLLLLLLLLKLPPTGRFSFSHCLQK